MLEHALFHFTSSQVSPSMPEEISPTFYTPTDSLSQKLDIQMAVSCGTAKQTASTRRRHRRTNRPGASASYTDLSILLKSTRIEEEDVSISDSEISKSKNPLQLEKAPQRARKSSLVNNDIPENNNSDTAQIDVTRLVERTKKIKKTVCFADEKGMKLTRVKVMSEASNTPPFLSRNIIEKYLLASNSEKPTGPPRKWLTQFTQPASQYLAFRQKLESSFVSLENVIIDDDIISGTIKVKNVSFEKSVFLRVTYDKWTSFQDIPATFFSTGEGPVRYDTFEFKFQIPPNISSAMAIEDRADFCVCYKCDQGEFWDNNSGSNYILLHEKKDIGVAGISVSSPNMYTPDFKPNFNGYDSLTTFRAWRHYATETSYY